MRFNEGQRVRVLQRDSGIAPGEIVTIIKSEKQANVERYKATNGEKVGFFTKDMLEEVEVLPNDN